MALNKWRTNTLWYKCLFKLDVSHNTPQYNTGFLQLPATIKL